MGKEKSTIQSPIVVGLDIGTTKICVIVGRRTQHGKIEVLGIGKAESAGVTRGVVSNIQKTVQGISQAVELASSQSNVEIRVVNVGIAGQHIKSLQHRGILTRRELNSEIGKKDIDKLIDDMFKLVMPPGEEIIHVLPQEFTIDNEPGVKDPIGMAGVRLEAARQPRAEGARRRRTVFRRRVFGLLFRCVRRLRDCVRRVPRRGRNPFLA